MFACSSSLDSVQGGATALHVASQEGHCEVVRILLEAKADVNMKDDVSESCSSDSTVIVLVCVMFVTDSVQDEATALHMASQDGHCEVVGTLLEAKADVNMKTNVSESCSGDGLGEHMFTLLCLLQLQRGAIALHIACENGHLEVVETLITASASVNAL